MVKINDPRQEIARRIYKTYEDKREDWRRLHLGASQIGKECLRELWYGFRWWTAPDFPGRILRLFERGHREEPWLADDLRAAGIEVQTEDPETGKQFLVSWLGGHFGGSGDGKLLNVPEAPDKPHVWECKTSSRKKFLPLQKKGVQKAMPQHYAQAQTYMLGMGYDRALYTAVNKDDDTIYVERIKLDKRFANGLVAKAESIISAEQPPLRISNKETFFLCRFCDHKESCHGDGMPERNCRTCTHSRPLSDGTWGCLKYEVTIEAETQKRGCEAWEGI